MSGVFSLPFTDPLAATEITWIPDSLKHRHQMVLTETQYCAIDFALARQAIGSHLILINLREIE
jgi:hypothetical protein